MAMEPIHSEVVADWIERERNLEVLSERRMLGVWKLSITGCEADKTLCFVIFPSVSTGSTHFLARTTSIINFTDTGDLVEKRIYRLGVCMSSRSFTLLT